jgi:hypothetical protein
MERHSELTVITKAKELCSYVMDTTLKSPKQFRFSFSSKMQSLALSAIENLYRANDVYVPRQGGRAAQERRLEYQHAALTDLRLLCYFAVLGAHHHAILPKQMQVIGTQGAECQRLVGAWIASDRRRYAAAAQPAN